MEIHRFLGNWLPSPGDLWWLRCPLGWTLCRVTGRDLLCSHPNLCRFPGKGVGWIPGKVKEALAEVKPLLSPVLPVGFQGCSQRFYLLAVRLLLEQPREQGMRIITRKLFHGLQQGCAPSLGAGAAVWEGELIPDHPQGGIRDFLHGDPSSPCAQELPGMDVDQRPLGPPGC